MWEKKQEVECCSAASPPPPRVLVHVNPPHTHTHVYLRDQGQVLLVGCQPGRSYVQPSTVPSASAEAVKGQQTV